jgi:ketosteroid isomerase-like protein
MSCNPISKIRLAALAASLACLCLWYGAAGAAGADSKQGADEAAIRATLERATQSYLKRDAVGAMEPYVKSDELHVFDLMLPVYHMGYADNLKSTQNFIDGAVGPVHVDYSDVSVLVDHDHAYSHAIVHIRADMKSGTKTDFTDRTTDVWERRGGKWLIIHEHNSVALDPARASTLLNAGGGAGTSTN